MFQRVDKLFVGPAARRAWGGTLWALVVIVCVLATLPKPPAQLTLGWDKLNHALAFTALAMAAALAYPPPLLSRIGLALALLAYGALIEVVQSAVSGRTAEWFDLLADALGIVIGTAVAAALVRTARSVPHEATRPPRPGP